MYELLALGNTPADSSYMLVAAGAPITVAITYDPDFLPREAFLDVLLETQTDVYLKVGRLSKETPALLLVAPGHYIVRREDLVAREITVDLGAVTSDSRFD